MANFRKVSIQLLRLLGVRPWRAAIVLALLGVNAILEGVGAGMLLPVLQYLQSGGQQVPSSGLWTYLTQLSAALGFPINLVTLLLMAFVPIALSGAFYYLAATYLAVVGNTATAQLTVRTFRALVRAQVGFVDSRDQGKLMGSITTEIARCGIALTQYFYLLSATAIAAAYAVVLLWLSWPLAVIVVLGTTLVTASMNGIVRRARSESDTMTASAVGIAAAVRERLGLIRLVQMRTREDEETDKIAAFAKSAAKANTRVSSDAARIEVLVDIITVLLMFVTIYVGITFFGMTLATMGLFMFVLQRLNQKAKSFNAYRQILASFGASVEYVENVLIDAEGHAAPTGGTRVFEGLKQGISFEDVEFAYAAGGPLILKGVSMEIPRFTTTAIVGRSGAGKSTLVDLLPAFRQPTAGTVKLDGVELSEFDPATLRRRIGYLTQEPMLLNDTIERNLTYGIEGEVTEEAVRNAIELGHCAEFVDALPDGLQTVIGDRGVRFSGGQRQRLALARVILQQPDVLILDEPTSALDSHAEGYIQRALDTLASKTTIIVIAHRLATVQKADNIVVLEHGEIVEAGTESELLHLSDGRFRYLFEMQMNPKREA